MIWLVILGIVAIVSGRFMFWKQPVLPKEINHTSKTPRLSLIIPARNEAKNLPILLDSVRKQTVQPIEIIVADDASTDETVKVAQQYGAQVVLVQKEAGWKGKTAGCWQGAEAAQGDWFLFMDADTYFSDARALERVLSAYVQQGSKGMLSIQPYHVIKKGYENFSVVFNILVMAGMNMTSILTDRGEETGAFGPFFLCTKENYRETGGHKAAKESLIEGFALGRVFAHYQLPLHLYNGKGAVSFRMYPEGWTQLVNGWTKHFASGAQQTQSLVMIWIGLWIAGGFVLPAVLLWSLIQSSWVISALILYGVYAVQFYVFARRVGSFHWLTAAFFLAAFLFFVGVFLRSWIATHIVGSVQWKGEKIDL